MVEFFTQPKGSLRLLSTLILPLLFALLTQASAFAQTTVLYSENFNAPKVFTWAGSGGDGNVGPASFSSTIVTNLSTNNGFPTIPTSGYLALTANSSSKGTNGWYADKLLW
jgi:hypothetical protein